MPIIVTSYEIVMADRRHLERHVWKLVVVDEVGGRAGGRGPPGGRRKCGVGWGDLRNG